MKLFATAYFISSALAATPIWGAYPSNPECDACLDATYASCPGDYTSESYARCMCAGDGSTNTVSCVSICGVPDNLGISWADNVASGWYTYCIMFDEFKSLCAEAEYYVTPELWADPARCGGVDTSGGGSGSGDESGGGSGDDSGEEGSNAEEGSNSGGDDSCSSSEGGSGGPGFAKPTAKPTQTTGENQPASTEGAAGRPSTSTAAGNAANPLPTLGVMVGLGIQLMGMNL